jgi:hypothetical protein
MKQEIILKVPTSWEAVTLKDYLALRKDMETYKDEPEAITACLFHHLCKFPVQYLNQMDIDTYVAIKRDLEGFFNKAEHPLKRYITIDGVEYGFEPNLSNMAYGAYVDISKYETIGIDDKWAEIMSILYRPVTQKMGALYDIKTYNGNIDKELFMDVPMDVHFGALFFLINLQADLLKGIPKSLTESMELPRSIQLILERSGNHTHLWSNYHKEILPKSMQ